MSTRKNDEGKGEKKDKEKEKGGLIVLEDLFSLPNHSRIWTWPKEELKKVGINTIKKTDKRYFVRLTGVSDQTSSSSTSQMLTIEMCRVERIYPGRKTNYVDDVVIETVWNMQPKLFEAFKFLTSKDYRDKSIELKTRQKLDEEIKRKEDRQLFIEKYIPSTNIELQTFIKDITREYFAELYLSLPSSTNATNNVSLTNCFNIDAIAQSSIPDFQNNCYWFAGGTNYTKSENQKSILEERMFHNHYPIFTHFLSEISKSFIKENDYESKNFQNSLVKKLNFKYNTKLVEFIQRRLSSSTVNQIVPQLSLSAPSSSTTITTSPALTTIIPLAKRTFGGAGLRKNQ